MWNMTLTCLVVGSVLLSNDGKEWKIISTSTSAELFTGCARKVGKIRCDITTMDLLLVRGPRIKRVWTVHVLCMISYIACEIMLHFFREDMKESPFVNELITR